MGKKTRLTKQSNQGASCNTGDTACARIANGTASGRQPSEDERGKLETLYFVLLPLVSLDEPSEVVAKSRHLSASSRRTGELPSHLQSQSYWNSIPL